MSLAKAVWIFLLTISVLNVARAQDAFKVEPTHYKLDFENETVQVVNVHYGPHEKSSQHSHPGGVVVTLTPSHLKFTDEHGKVRETRSMAGEARWFPPFKHSVENLGILRITRSISGSKLNTGRAWAAQPEAKTPAVRWTPRRRRW